MNPWLDADQVDEKDQELTLRPQSLKDYVGQSLFKNNLAIFMQAAKERNEALDHVLLSGPPGLGKTTLAHIIAHEMGGNLRVIAGPAVDKTGDLAAVLSLLEPGDVLFIDEIHRLPKVVEEVLYSAMEDFVLDVIIGSDQGARPLQIDLPPFTLVGATTREGDLSAPLRDRFGIKHRLAYYQEEELQLIADRSAQVFGVDIDETALTELAKRSRGTPRIVNRLLRRVRDFAQVLNDNHIDLKLTRHALKELGVDDLGLDDVDISYLRGIIERFKGGPVGLEALASSIGAESTTLEDVYEPYLIQIGFINRTPRGRMATSKAYDHLKINYQLELFDGENL